MWGWVILGVVAGALALLALWCLLVMAARGEKEMERFLRSRGQVPGFRGQGSGVRP